MLNKYNQNIQNHQLITLHRSKKTLHRAWNILVETLVILCLIGPCLTTDTNELEIKSNLCEKSQPLGMESGAITDKQINASSSYDTRSVGPQHARLNKDTSGGAWCPSQQISFSNSGTEFIEVHFNDRKVINGVATQGRFGNSVGVEFVEEFYLEYSRDGGLTWIKWKNRKGNHILKANQDTYSIADNWLDLPIVGVNAIRLIPYSQYVRQVCLRFELYGCNYKDGPIRYSMPDGEFGGRYGDLVDDNYDGIRHKNFFLTKGLGQLTDGILGLDDYKANSGYEWIGWKANSNNSVEILFEFEDLVNFTSITIHCHNLYHVNIEYFQQVVAYFSIDNNNWSKHPVIKNLVPDHQNDNPREIIVDLKNRLGKYVKIVLKFAAKWLLVSEMKFNIKHVSKNYLPKIEDLEYYDSKILKKSLFIQKDLSKLDKNENKNNEDTSLFIKKLNFNQMSNEVMPKKSTLELDIKSKFNQNQFANSLTFNIILISSVIFICFFIFLLVSIIFYRKFNKKSDLLASNIIKTTLVQNNKKLELIHKLQNSSNPSSHSNTLIVDNLNLPIYSPITGSSSLLNQNNSSQSNDSSLVRSESNHEYAVPNLSHYEEINPSDYTSFYNKINDYEYNKPNYQDNLKQNKYITTKINTFKPSMNMFNSIGSNGNLFNTNSLEKPNKNLKSFKPTTMKFDFNGSVNKLNHQLTIKSNNQLQINSNIQSFLCNDLKLKLISKDQLKLVHNLIGRSKFGSLNLSKYKSRDCLDLTDNFNDPNIKFKQLVLIETINLKEMSYENLLVYKKQLINWINVICQTNSSNPINLTDSSIKFLKQKTLSNLSEELKNCLPNSQSCFSNILGLINSESFLNNQIHLVMDYSNGSLANFLKGHSHETISNNFLMNLTNQLVNAMYFLELNNLPYITLCCKNISFNKSTLKIKLVMPEILLDETIVQNMNKIKNLGNKKFDKSEINKFNLNQQLRWLAPENLTNANFDCKSDVFSFGNTIWEMFNFCKISPYPQLKEEQILELFAQSFADLNYQINLKRTKQFNDVKENDSDSKLNSYNKFINDEISIIQLKPLNMDDETYQILLNCWILNSDKRLSFGQCLKFFNNKCYSSFNETNYCQL